MVKGTVSSRSGIAASSSANDWVSLVGREEEEEEEEEDEEEEGVVILWWYVWCTSRLWL